MLRMQQVWVWLCAYKPSSGKFLNTRQFNGTFLHLPLFQQPQVSSVAVFYVLICLSLKHCPWLTLLCHWKKWKGICILMFFCSAMIKVKLVIAHHKSRALFIIGSHLGSTCRGSGFIIGNKCNLKRVNWVVLWPIRMQCHCTFSIPRSVNS